MSQAEAKINDTADESAGQNPDLKEVSREQPFALNGRAFTRWLNNKIARANRPTITLGTKTATVVMLGDDGALVVDVDGEDVKGERQRVAFEEKYLDQLLPQLKG